MAAVDTEPIPETQEVNKEIALDAMHGDNFLCY